MFVSARRSDGIIRAAHFSLSVSTALWLTEKHTHTHIVESLSPPASPQGWGLSCGHGQTEAAVNTVD